MLETPKILFTKKLILSIYLILSMVRIGYIYVFFLLNI